MLLVDNDFLPLARSIINSAQHRIDICTFKGELITKPRGKRLLFLFQNLYEKRAAGVEVRFLINWHDGKRGAPLANRNTINELKKNKIDVRGLTANRCCHAKIILVDGKKAIIGSHNLSVNSCHSNFEISYIIMDPASLARLASVFNTVFRKAKPL